jgi:hypothetical protein
VKRTAPGWGLDTAFAFTSHEDGGGAAGWAQGVGTGGAVSSVADAARHPDGEGA